MVGVRGTVVHKLTVERNPLNLPRKVNERNQTALDFNHRVCCGWLQGSGITLLATPRGMLRLITWVWHHIIGSHHGACCGWFWHHYATGYAAVYDKGLASHYWLRHTTPWRIMAPTFKLISLASISDNGWSPQTAWLDYCEPFMSLWACVAMFTTGNDNLI